MEKISSNIQSNHLNLDIKKVSNVEYIPIELLELADPSKSQIESYIKTGICYLAFIESNIVGAIILLPVDESTIEIKNIAVDESLQGQRIGTELLKHSVKVSRDVGFHKLLIGTGNSSLKQLALYQKFGFEVDHILKNFFIDNYDEPIFENDIQCKHMIILSMEL